MKKYIVWCLYLLIAAQSTLMAQSTAWTKRVIKDQRDNILKQASWALQQKPETVTAAKCERSAGGLHDFYSEGDYWWPDPRSADSPYIQRDGQSNPDNFVAHRQAMIRFSRVMGTLAAAYLVKKDKTYLQHALIHVKAWFINQDTRMNPNLQYAQAIKGRATGRGIGIIDTIHFLEVVQAIRIMEQTGTIPPADLKAVKQWFTEYLQWMTTHPYGIAERDATNNHGTCWVMQVAAFAKLLDDQEKMDYCIRRYKEVLLPNQMAPDGSYPRELARTKPYGYMLFNLDAMATICQILSNRKENLWQYTVSNNRNMGKAILFMYPYINNKQQWPYPKDIMYWDNWPVAQPALLFGAAALGKQEYYDLWNKLDHNPQVEEVLRNLPIRNPLIWL
ncbi:alginate lyase family protein [Chitinophaga pendula]|uniref:alginate lyase family protein n=1 Tax=Chitinophaga TaxID=79328 RepID=UPI000BAF0267|nr:MULTISPECIES: alginate lyase family protein [Chitinophaga]ASZ11124.1 alginate lyase [Chitinophaga sp. MD30]UCJ05879.1 alginate lyase family protein [Chitinophaga pendula]